MNDKQIIKQIVNGIELVVGKHSPERAQHRADAAIALHWAMYGANSDVLEVAAGLDKYEWAAMISDGFSIFEGAYDVAMTGFVAYH